MSDLRRVDDGSPARESILSASWLSQLAMAAGARPMGGLRGFTGPDFVAVVATGGGRKVEHWYGKPEDPILANSTGVVNRVYPPGHSGGYGNASGGEEDVFMLLDADDTQIVYVEWEDETSIWVGSPVTCPVLPP